MKGELPLVDGVVLVVLLVAVARGLWIGLIREGLSLAAIGIATIVTRLGVEPLALRLTAITEGELQGKAALWIAGVLLVVASVIAVGFLARLIARGVVY
ncbi:MAG TPA: CvpA family protein, partial [Myxococcota bacterium]|nr:CvpA family protein [Myxococcota bacterium]